MSHRVGIRAWAVALLVATGLVAAVSAQSDSTPPKSFLWEVSHGTRVLYLAGSIHALTADAYPLNPAFERAFESAGTLVEEIDLSEGDLQTLGPVLLSKGLYQDGRTFDSVVTKETLALVLQRLGSPLALQSIRSMKPWMIMLTLMALEVQRAGLKPELGLDRYFFDKARAAGKPVVGLETAESQLDRFDAMPESLQEQLLRSGLEELDLQQRELHSIVDAWRRGDGGAVERLTLAGFQGYPDAYRSLVVERNQNWMPQLEACLTRPSPCFVVVGAAHLVGPDGLLALLQARGYRVEQL